MRCRRRHGQDHQLGASGQRVLYPLRHLRIRRLQDVDAAKLVQPCRRHAGKIARTVGGEGELARCGFFQGHQLADAFGIDRRMCQHQKWCPCHHADGREVARRIVGQRLEGVGIGHQCRSRGKEQRVAIGWCARRHLCADDIAAAGAIVDDDLLIPVARQPLRYQSRHDVRCAASGLRHDQSHAARWPVRMATLGPALCCRLPGAQRTEGDGQPAQAAADGVVSRLALTGHGGLLLRLRAPQCAEL